MAGVIKVGGASASVKLQGNDTITSDQTFTFPNTGGELAINGGGGGGGNVTYNGASAWGVVSAAGDFVNGFNVDGSQVTRTADGNYRVIFATPLSTDSYGLVATALQSPAESIGRYTNVTSKDKNGFNVKIRYTATDGQSISSNNAFSFIAQESNSVPPPHGVGSAAWALLASSGEKQGSYNIDTVVRNGDGDFTISFISPMPTSNYAVTATATSTGSRIATVSNQSATGFDLKVFTEDGTTTNNGVHFAVHASSTVTPTFTWTRDGTTLKPANDGDSLKSAGPYWYDSVLPKAFNNTAFQASGSDGIGAIVTSIGTTLIGGDLDQPFGSMSPNITLGSDGSITAAGEVNGRNFKCGDSSSSGTSGPGVVSGLNGGKTLGRIGIYNNTVSSSEEVFVVRSGAGSATKTVRASITSDGTIDAKNVAFRLDPDNSANYVSTMVDGEEQQVYSGPTLDVRQVLLDLQSKVEALQAEIETLKGGAS